MVAWSSRRGAGEACYDIETLATDTTSRAGEDVHKMEKVTRWKQRRRSESRSEGLGAKILTKERGENHMHKNEKIS